MECQRASRNCRLLMASKGVSTARSSSPIRRGGRRKRRAAGGAPSKHPTSLSQIPPDFTGSRDESQGYVGAHGLLNLCAKLAPFAVPETPRRESTMESQVASRIGYNLLKIRR